MKSETRLQNRLAIPETRHHCYLQPIPFRLALLTLVGRDEGTAAGRLFGMTGKTVDRALAGGVVSETLIANALAAFRLNTEKLAKVGLEVSFDTFFRCGTSDEPTDRATVGTEATV